MDRRKETLRDLKICRFCLSSDEKNLTSIYQRDVKMAPLTVQIMSCISIEVFPSDGLPQFICTICKLQTNQSYIFKTNCKKADDALKNFLQTGDLIKPERSKLIRKPTTPIFPVKDVKIVESSEPESNSSKRIKLKDGTEIITLCITNIENSTQDDSSQDSLPNDEDLGDTFQEDDLNQCQESIKQVETDIFPCEQCDRSFPLKQLLDIHVQNHSRERIFSCATCGNEFFTKYDLQIHEKSHSDVKPFNCGVCGKDFFRESLLRRHEQTHSDAKKYVCNYCNKTFILQEDLSIHIMKHEKKRPFTCKECDKSFVFKQGLERHMTSFHTQDKPHKCNYCEASFSSQIRLTRHITTHAGLRPYPCKICGRTFLLSHHLTRHMRNHYAADQTVKPEGITGQHKCDICSMSFRRNDSLINHSAIHSMVNLRCVICNTSFETADMVKEHITSHLEDLPYPCEKCDYSFENEHQLEEHEVKHAEMEYEDQIEKEVLSEVQEVITEPILNEFCTEHGQEASDKTNSNIKPFNCIVCGKEFIRESLLKKHKQIHSETKEYICNYCSKSFLFKEDLSVHVMKHEKKIPFTCKECDKSFVFKQGLEHHMTSFHTQDKPHKCNYCEATFSTQIRLTRHLTTHAGLRPYPCKICGRTFLLSHHLTRHMRSHYAAEQNMNPEEVIGQHKCDICSMSFRRKDNLINHSAIHSMVNLRCVICNTSFETADMVKEHITTHLQGLPFPCEKCDYSFENQYQLEEHEVKHAEMEYEDQIEKEVLSEAKHIMNESADTDEEYAEDESEVAQYHITDINNPELIPAGSQTELKQVDTAGASVSTKQLNRYFKPSTDVQGSPSTEDDENHTIKPIFRTEGTKMYERKGPIQRKLPKVPTEKVKTAPLEQINEKPRIERRGITSDLSNLPSKKPVNVKVGDKVVKVQKFIITKEEMKQMAKLGILEVKNGQVTMKNPGQPILNATIKPVQPSDIENLINIQKQKTPIKQYDRKSKQSSSSAVDSVIEDFS